MDETDSLRDRLLRAAIVEFASHGYAGGRVDRIAEDAKVNKQLIYHYFGDKRGIYRETLNRMIDSYNFLTAPLVETANDTASLEERFRQSAEIFQGETLYWFYILGWEGLQPFEEPLEAYERRHSGFAAARDSIRAAQKSGHIDDSLDPDLTMILMTAVSMMPYLLPQLVKLMTDQSVTDPDFQLRYNSFIEKVLHRVGDPGSKQP